MSLLTNNLIVNDLVVDMPKININLIDNYLEGAANNIVRRRIIIESSAPEIKTIKIVEQSSAATRANVCKYISSFVWLKK